MTITIQKRTSLSEKAYNELKNALVSGEIEGGEILSENQLAKGLGMSRTPVHEALRALASEGFVEIRDGVGVYVRPLSSKDAHDLFEVRCLLELQAVQTSVYRISDAEIDDLERRFRVLLRTCEDDAAYPLTEFSHLDWELHDLLVQRCTNRYLRSIMDSNAANMRRYQYLSFEALHDIRESTSQHLKILEALRRRDLDQLTQILSEHLAWAADFLQKKNK